MEIKSMEPIWLKWAKELQTIAQSGLTYCRNEFDIERYKQLQLIVAEIIAHQADEDLQKVTKLLMDEKGYSTPKVDVRGAVFIDNKVLLVKEISDGGWTLPGGWADQNETPREAVEREVFEESGYKVEAYKLAAVMDRTVQGHSPYYPFHVYKIFFLCRITGGASKNSIETTGADFFPIDKLPPLSTARTKESQINILHKIFKNPDEQTYFE